MTVADVHSICSQYVREPARGTGYSEYGQYCRSYFFPELASVADISPDNRGMTFSEVFYIILMIFRILQSILAFGANILVLVAFKCYPHLQQSTTCLICGLSIADLLAATLAPMALLISTVRDSNSWVYIEHVKMVLMSAFAIGNVTFSTLIAVERALTLTYPLTYMTFITLKRTGVCVVIAWTYITICLTVLSITSHAHYTSVPQTIYSEIVVLTPTSHSILSVHFYILVVIAVGSYTLITRLALEKERAGKNHQHHQHHQHHSRDQWKLTKMMMTVVLVFVVCYIPGVIVNQIIRYAGEDPEKYLNWYMLTSLIYLVSSFINPFLYATKSKHFRIAFRKLLPNWFVRRTLLSNSIVDSFVANA